MFNYPWYTCPLHNRLEDKLRQVGLLFFPSLLPSKVQMALLDKLMHRDLSNPEHLTNLHLFHEVIYPAGSSAIVNIAHTSFFAMDPATSFEPKDSAIHKTMTVSQMLKRKLRWMTLGGQYDWTAKVYPKEQPPPFPSDVAGLLRACFPEVDAQAAIVNLYTPGDTLSVHRDVSEECDRGLISVSIGCDALFIVANEDASVIETIRLRSGDGVLMSGLSRYLWHAVPKVLPDTCPAQIADWPATSNESAFTSWKGWMQTKRINLNVRQMKEVP
jgi:DNA alkylation damage repair protein AlkB